MRATPFGSSNLLMTPFGCFNDEIEIHQQQNGCTPGLIPPNCDMFSGETPGGPFDENEGAEFCKFASMIDHKQNNAQMFDFENMQPQ